MHLKLYFLVFLLGLASCSSKDIASEIEGLKIMDEVLQHSVAHLLKHGSSMKEQLKDMNSALSGMVNETKVTELENDLRKSEQKMQGLINWTKEADVKLSHSQSAVNMSVLEDVMKPVRNQIENMTMNLVALSQKGDAEMVAVPAQALKLQHLFSGVDNLEDVFSKSERKMFSVMEALQESTRLRDRIEKGRKKNGPGLKLLRDTMNTWDQRLGSVKKQIGKNKNSLKEASINYQKIMKKLKKP